MFIVMKVQKDRVNVFKKANYMKLKNLFKNVENVREQCTKIVP